MIWKYWPISDLQQMIGDTILDQIGEILPLVDSDGEGIFFETNKKKLVMLMAAFSDEKYFTRIESVEKCLNYLPPEVLDSMVSHLEIKLPQDASGINDKLSKSIAKNVNYRCKFLEFFGLPKRFYPATSETKPHLFTLNAPTFDQPVLIRSAYKVLKDFQYDIYYRMLEILTPAMSRTILQMPTGSGKTRTAMELISNHLNSQEPQKKRVVWLANSEELCEQAVACFVDVWQHVGRKDVEIQRLWGGNPKPQESQYSTDTQFIVGSLQSLWKLVQTDGEEFQSIFSSVSLLVIDEAHIAVAKTYSAVVKRIVQLSHSRVVGLTATPGRAIEEETTELSELFHSEIVSLRDPRGEWENSIAYLRSINVLSQVTYAPLLVDSDVSLSKSELKKLEVELDFPTSVLKKVGKSTIRSAEIAARIRPLLKESAKVLLFAPSIENSKFLTSLFIFLGFSAAHIDGSTNSVTRSQIINDYITGELQIICNYGVLVAGFDAPKTDVVCIARPTKSPVLYSQMIGRGLRGPAVGGTSDCLIIEVQDNFVGQGTQDELYEYFGEYWQK